MDFDANLEPYETTANLLGIELDSRTIPLMNGKTRQEPAILYSGFYSQGDGASFTGRYGYVKGSVKAIKAEFPTDEKLHRIAEGLAELQRKYSYRLKATVTQSGNYVHKYTMDIEDVCRSDWRSGQDVEIENEYDQKALLELMRDFAQWIYDGLEEEHEYQMSDESVDDTLAANEYEFTADGKRFVA
jgi:hypothetical protein